MTAVGKWSTAEWRAQAAAWLDEQLGKAGIKRTGEITQPRIRPWGTVLNAPTNTGPVWLKAPGPETVFEVRLYELLRDIAPEWVLEPIATDVSRGWVLLPDGGTALRESGDDPIEAMVKILPQYGDLQRRLMPHVSDLLAAGVTDMRASVMPSRFEQAVEAVTRRADAEDMVVVRQIVGRREFFRERCLQAAALSIEASLDHNDLHAGNVFVTGGRARFYDWGDSVVSHPFASMVVALGSMPHMYGISEDDPVITRLRDSYLEAFSDLAPHKELVEQLDLACWIGIAARTLVWERALVAQDEPGEWEKAPLAVLEHLLSDNWLESSHGRRA